MKFSKKSLFRIFAFGATGTIVAGTAIAATTSIMNVNKNTVSSQILFDGKVFNSTKERDDYILSNSSTVTEEIVKENGFYTYNSDGSKKFLTQEQVVEMKSTADANTTSFQIVSTESELDKYTLANWGMLDGVWLAENNVNPFDTKITHKDIFYGTGGSSFNDSIQAAESFLNSGYEIYQFNGIYFEDKESLRSYLNEYLRTPNENISESFRVIAPNGSYSDKIVIDNEGKWLESVTSFIEANVTKVLKITKSNGQVVFVDPNNQEAVSKEISVSDIPYVSVDSNGGLQNWVVGLRSDDDYQLSGPSFYSGYENLSGMNYTFNWKQGQMQTSQSIFSPEKQYIFAEATNSFFGRFFDEGSNITDNGVLLNSGNLLFADKNKTRIRNMTLDTNGVIPEERTISTEIEVEGIGDVTFEQTTNKGEALTSTDITKKAQNLYNYFNTSKYSYVYDEVLEAAKSFASSKSYSFLLKIPLLYYVFIDRLMCAGAPQDTIDYVREFFYDITSVVESILDIQLGNVWKIPVATKEGYGELDLHDLFDISLDNSQTIDFNIQEIGEILSNVYPTLTIATTLNTQFINDSKMLLAYDAGSYNNIMSATVDSYYSNESAAYSESIKSLLLASENRINGYWLSQNIFDDSMLAWISDENSKESDFIAWKMITAEFDDNTFRDTVLDIIVDEVNELISANGSWSLVSNANRFKLYEFYQREYNNEVAKDPDYYVSTIGAFDYRTLLFWNNVFVQMEAEISSHNKYKEIADIWNNFFGDDLEQNDYYEDYINEETLESNKAFVNSITSGQNSLSFNHFGGIIQDFESYASLTLIRMLADIAEDETLFISDSKYDTKKINPQYATKATQIVFDLLRSENVDEDTKVLLNKISLLYRGFQKIQKSIDKCIMTSETGEIIDSDIVVSIIKHTAQYSSIVNEYMSFFKGILSDLSIPAKKGQIIAYSGSTKPNKRYINAENVVSTDNGVEYKYETNVPLSNNLNDLKKGQLNDGVSLVANIYEKGTNKKLDTYVIPDTAIKNGEFTDDIYFANTVYVTPANAYDMTTINMFDYSFDKYFDVDLLKSSYDYKTEDFAVSHDGLFMYYSPYVIFDTHPSVESFINDVNYDIISQWGYYIATTSSDSDTSTDVVLASANTRSYTGFVIYNPSQNKINYADNKAYYNRLTSIDLGKSSWSTLSDSGSGIYKLTYSKPIYLTRYEASAPSFSEYTGTLSSKWEPNRNVLDSTYQQTYYKQTKYDKYLTADKSLKTRTNALAGRTSESKLTSYSSDFTKRKSITIDNVGLGARYQCDGISATSAYRNDTDAFAETFKKQTTEKILKNNGSRYLASSTDRWLSGMSYDELCRSLTISDYILSASPWYEKQVLNTNKQIYEGYCIRHFGSTSNAPDDPFLKHIVETGKVDKSLMNKNPDATSKWKTTLSDSKSLATNTLNKQFMNDLNNYAVKHYKPSESSKTFLDEMNKAAGKRTERHLEGWRRQRNYEKNLANYKTNMRGVTVDGLGKHDKMHVDLNDRRFAHRLEVRAQTASDFDKFAESYWNTKQLRCGASNKVWDVKAEKLIDYNMRDFAITRYKDAIAHRDITEIGSSKWTFYDNEAKIYNNWTNRISQEYLSTRALNNSATGSQTVNKTGNVDIETATRVNTTNLSSAELVAAENRQKAISKNNASNSNNVVSNLIDDDISTRTYSGVMRGSISRNTTSPVSSAVNSPEAARSASSDWDPDLDMTSTTDSNSIIATKTKNLKTAKLRGYFSQIMKFGKVFLSVLGTAFALLEVGMMIYELVLMFTQETTYYINYTYEAGEVSWSWNGGEYWTKGNFFGQNIQAEQIRSIGNMKLMNPIKVNNTYESDFKYFNGKMYKTDDELKKAFVDYILYKELKTQESNEVNSTNNPVKISNNIELKYTFVNEKNKDMIDQYSFDTVSEVVANVKDVIVSSKDEIESIYTTKKITTISDEYNNFYDSSNTDAVIDKTIESILNKIKPSLVSVLPNKSETPYSTEVNKQFYWESAGQFKYLPGTSWDPLTKTLVTPENKIGYIPGQYIIDNTLNDKKDGTLINNSTIEEAKNKLIKNSINLIIGNGLINASISNLNYLYASDSSIWTMDTLLPTDSFSKTYKFTDLYALQSSLVVYDIIRYVDENHNVYYFRDLFYGSSNNKITARENYESYFNYINNINRIQVKESKTYIVYNGVKYNSLADVIKSNS